MHRPHAHGRIVKVPNRKTNTTDHMVEFDKENKLVDGLTHKRLYSSFPYNSNDKKLLKRGVERADIIDHRCKDKPKMWKNRGAESAETAVAANLTESFFLGRMLNENDEGTSVSRDPIEGATESDDDSLSDEGSDCKLDVSAFQTD